MRLLTSILCLILFAAVADAGPFRNLFSRGTSDACANGQCANGQCLVPQQQVVAPAAQVIQAFPAQAVPFQTVEPPLFQDVKERPGFFRRIFRPRGR